MANKIIVCLVGKSAAGKDSIAYLLSQQQGWHNVVSCTTRPKRDYEIEGKNYYFISEQEFAEKVLNGDMIEATCFNGWYYGTLKSALQDGINIGVWNPEGYDCLKETMKYDKDVKILSYYIQCSDKTRLLRSLNREEFPDVHEIVRRFSTDEEDFEWLDEGSDDTITVLYNEKDSDMIKCFHKILEDVSLVING